MKAIYTATRNVLLACLLLMCFTHCLFAEEWRFWKPEGGGASLEAEFVSLSEDGQFVILKTPEGTGKKVLLSKLSLEDRNWIQNRLKKEAAPAVPNIFEDVELPKEREDWTLSKASQQPGLLKVLNINGIPYRFHWCPSGSFLMGAPSGEKDRDKDELQHRVILTKSFWMLETEVTQEMWLSVKGDNPSKYNWSNQLPVEKVSWEECLSFIEELNRRNIAPKGYVFALPTEAQWEYACRAGTTTPYYWGVEDEKGFDKNKKYKESDFYREPNSNMAGNAGGIRKAENTKSEKPNGNISSEKTDIVKSFTPNPWGLYDMHGNVWEWCLDKYGNYDKNDAVDPVGVSGTKRVARGGRWINNSLFSRSADRYWGAPKTHSPLIGFRIVLVEEDEN